MAYPMEELFSTLAQKQPRLLSIVGVFLLCKLREGHCRGADNNFRGKHFPGPKVKALGSKHTKIQIMTTT